MKPRVLILLRLLLCFSLLALLRDPLVACYRSLLEVIGSLLLTVDVAAFDCGEICSLRLIVYLALVMVVPSIGWLQRSLILVTGLSVFVAIDLAGLYLWPKTLPFMPVGGETSLQLIYGIIWNVLRELLLPLLLWVVICDRHIGLFFPEAGMAEALREEDRFSAG